MASPSEPGPGPALSVLILAFNRRTFLGAAVRSVLRSTLDRSRFEVIVVKNFDDEELDPILAREGVVVLQEPPEPVGVWMAKGVARARGRVVCLLNDDDEFEPEKLARIDALFRGAPELTFVHDRRHLIDANGVPLPVAVRRGPSPRAVRVATARDRTTKAAALIDGRAHFYDSCMSVSRSVLLDDAEALRRVEVGEDAVVFFAALAHPGTLLLVEEALTRFRVHGQSTYAAQKTTSSKSLDRGSTVALVERMTQGTPAEPVARLYALGQKFNRFLSDERNPAPRGADFAGLAAAVARYRIRSQAVLLLLGTLGRVAPRTGRRMYARLRDAMDERVP
jgi:hypothetical protein